LTKLHCMDQLWCRVHVRARSATPSCRWSKHARPGRDMTCSIPAALFSLAGAAARSPAFSICPPPWVSVVDARPSHAASTPRPRLGKGQSLSRTRNPHAVSSRPFVFIDQISKPRSISNSENQHLIFNLPLSRSLKVWSIVYSVHRSPPGSLTGDSIWSRRIINHRD
jgi:hypothetical protein